MSILTHSALIEHLQVGDIQIEPYDEGSIGPASIDLRLGNEFRVYKTTRDIYPVNDKSNYEEITKVMTVDDYFLLMPGQTAHGITIEKLTLPPNLCAFIEGKSSIGRLGLTVHITAGFIHPGTSNQTVLELHNEGPIPLALYPGTKICQIIIMETVGQAVYQGKYKNQQQP